MRLVKLLLLIFMTALWFCQGTAQASVAQEQLKSGIDTILAVLQDNGLKGEANTGKRRQVLRQAVNERFDFQKMSQLSLGRHWKSLSKEQKSEFSQLFSRFLESTYIAKIEAYTNEKVVYVKERVKKKKAQINTKIITDTVEIPIDYRMYMKGSSQWMVYDMVIEGVSLVANYRSQFGQILDKDSFDVLVEKLESKIKED